MEAAKPPRILGLDALRFIAATWVVLSHYGAWTFLEESRQPGPLANALRVLASSLVNGPAAVIVFFVISGFCIHYPFARGVPFEAGGFLRRRMIRIALPLGAAAALAPLAGMPFRLLDRMATWSLFCELVYYAGYPLLRLLLGRLGIDKVIALSVVPALAVILVQPDLASRSVVNPTYGDYPSFGILGNTLLGLPCWLLGVRLAENLRAPRVWPPFHIWAWRLGVWAVSIVLLVLRFHTPIGYPWTLDLFGIAVAAWLSREIAHFAVAEPWGWLEWAGKWSYSLYLVHPLALPLFRAATAPGSGSILQWAGCIAVIYAGSYAFYVIVERPAHMLARWSSRSPPPARPDPGARTS